MLVAMRRCPALILSLVLSSAACGDDAAALPPLTGATALACPAPGDLPFRLATRGFARAPNAALAEERTRDKGEAGDTLGNPGGPTADTYVDDDGSPATGELAYRGRKARTATTNGLFSTGLPGERVSLWSYDAAAEAWSERARGETDADGAYALAPGEAPPPNGHPVYAMLEADGSCADHHAFLLPRGERVVITDIDGTLTTDDAELFEQVGDPAYVPRMKRAAAALMQAWAAKGYTIIYLTARPHVLRGETRTWLRDLGYPVGPVITAASLADPAGYKRRWIARLLATFGWIPAAAYGNATTDIEAYAAAGIPKDVTFIIGEHAGEDGTVAIAGDDYTDHLATFVRAQPDNR